MVTVQKETPTGNTAAEQNAAFEKWYLGRPMAYCAMTKEMLHRLFVSGWTAAAEGEAYDGR